MSRLRRAGIRLIAALIVIAAVVLIALAIELASWGLLRAKGKITERFGARYRVAESTRYEPFVGYRYAPFAKDVRPGLDADRHGFIHNGDASRDLSVKAPGVYRIFILGGSNVAGNGRPHETIAARLETLLNARGGPRRYEVVNAGVSAWLTSQDLAMLAFHLAPYQPDLVVSFSGFTDVYHAIRAPREGWLPDTNHHLVTQARAAYVHTYSMTGTFRQAFGLLVDRTYLREVIEEAGASLRSRTGGASAAPRAPAGLFPDPMGPYRRNLVMMIAAARAQHVPIAVILQPTMLVSNSAGLGYREAFRAEVASSWSLIDFWGEKDRLYAEARGIVADLGRRHDDGRTVIVRDYAAMFDQEREPSYLDQAHFTAAANLAIAQAMARDLRPLIAAGPTSSIP